MTKKRPKSKPVGAKVARIRCTFDITQDEAEVLCAMRCEPKPSTAAAQVVRMAIRDSARFHKSLWRG